MLDRYDGSLVLKNDLPHPEGSAGGRAGSTVAGMEHPEEPTTAETVQELSSDDHGRWLVTTKTSRHIWDLDAGTYRRIPGSDGPQFPWDGRAVHLTRVSAWPKVGGKTLIWFDDPSIPDALEQWRRSATVLRIERLPSQVPPAES